MKFFEHIYRSLWDIEWLAKAKDMKRRWAYFFLFMFLLATLTILPMFWQLPRAVSMLKGALENEVPAFTATLLDGNLSVGELPQPFRHVSTVENMGKTEEFVVYVDTTTSTANLTAKSLITKPDQSVVLITSDHFEVYDSGEETLQSQSYKNIPNATFSKNSILTFINEKGTMILGLILVAAIVILFVFGSLARLVYLVIWSAVISIIVKIAKKQGWEYGDIFNLGLSTHVLPSVVLLIAGYIAFRPPFVFTVIFLVLSLSVIFREVKKVETVKEHAAPKE